MEFRGVDDPLSAQKADKARRYRYGNPISETSLSLNSTTYSGPPIQKRIVTHKAWACLGLQSLSTAVTFAWFIAPGWGWTVETGVDNVHGEFEVSYGIWFFCSKSKHGRLGDTCTQMAALSDLPPWYKAVQALGFFGFFFTVTSFVLIICYVAVLKMNRQIPPAASIFATNIVSALLHTALFVLYAAVYLSRAPGCCPNDGFRIVEHHLFYCFGFACLTAILHGTCAVLAGVEFTGLLQ